MMRTVLTVVTVFVATMVLAPIVIVARLLGLREGEHGVAQRCMRTWARCMLVAAGVKVVVHNPERILRGRGAVFASNHVSWFDVFAIASVLPRYTFIAKAELRKLPLFGWGAESAGGRGVLRGSGRPLLAAAGSCGAEGGRETEDGRCACPSERRRGHGSILRRT